jgi:hypothetical protein
VARACGATTPASATPELPRQGTWNSPMRPKVLRGTALLGKPTHCGPQDERHAAQLPKGTRVERLPGEAPRAATLPGRGPRAAAPERCRAQCDPRMKAIRRPPGARSPAGLPGGAAQRSPLPEGQMQRLWDTSHALRPLGRPRTEQLTGNVPGGGSSREAQLPVKGCAKGSLP